MATQKSIEAVLRARDANFTSTFSKASNFVNKFKGSNQSATSSVKSIVSALGIYKVAGMAFSAVTNNMGNAVRRMDTMNNFPKVMKQMGFSADESKQSIDRLSKGVQGLPTALNDVVSTTQRIASFKGDIGKATSTTLALNNALLASGASGESAGRGLEQYVQMMSAGKVDMQAWKTLQETMPFALQKTAEAFGMTGSAAQKGLYEKLQSGEITFDQFNDKLIELSEAQGGFADMAKTSTAGIGTAFTNMKNAVVRGVTAMIGSFDKFLQKMTGTGLQGHIENIGKVFEENLTKMSSKLEQLGSMISPYVEVFKTSFAGVGTSVMNAVKSVLGSLGDMYGGFGNTASVQSFGEVMDSIANHIRSASSWIQAHSQQIATLIPQVVKLAVAYKIFQTLGGVFAPITQGALMAGQATQKLGSKILEMGAIPLGSHTKAMGFSFKQLGTSAMTSMGSVGSSLLSVAGPIAIVVAIIGSLVAAWTSNFGNIQGFTKKAFSAMKPAFESMGKSLNGLKPILSAVGTAFKFIGAVLIGTVVFAIAAVVDGLQGLLAYFKSVWDMSKAVGNGLKGIWKSVTGDTKGAEEAFGKAGDNFKQIGKNYSDVWDNSAIRGTIKATGELGKETDNVSKSQERLKNTMEGVKTSAGSLGGVFSTLNQTLQDTSSKMDEVFQGNEAMENFNKQALELITNGGKARQEAIERYNKAITDSEGKSENERQGIMQKANKTLMEDMTKNRSDLVSLYADYGQQLANNTDKSGQQMNQSQRTAMINQRMSVVDELSQTNQTYIDKLKERISLGDTVSKEETAQALTNLREMNAQKTETITQNNAELEALKQAQAQSSDEIEKAQYEQQIQSLSTKNQQLTESQTQFGADWLALLSTQNQTTAEQLATALTNEKNLTDENLASILESYRNNGASVSDQMTLMAGMLQEKGIEGAQNLSTALKSGDLTAIASSMSEEVQNGLMSLPPGMFTDGEQGRQKFVEALKAGDTKSAGAQLKDGVTQETAKTGEQTGKDGEKAGDNFNKKLDSKKGDAKNSGKNVADNAHQGMKSKEAEIKDTGNTAGYRYATGIDSRVGTAKNSGTSLSNAAKSGASSVGGFDTIGSNMAQGVASGINASAGSAVSAMTSLVDRVNAEAKKKAEIKSPSRLFKREIGANLALGVADGIKEKAKYALANMRDLVEQATGVTSLNGPIGLDFSGKIDTKQSNLVSKIDELIEATKDQLLVDGDTIVGSRSSQLDLIGYQNIQDRGRVKWR